MMNPQSDQTPDCEYRLTYQREVTLTRRSIAKLDQEQATEILAEIERTAPPIHPTLVVLLVRQASRLRRK